jgi:hypothetical protein
VKDGEVVASSVDAEAEAKDPYAAPYFDPLAPPTEEDLNAISRQVFAETCRRQRNAAPFEGAGGGKRSKRAARRPPQGNREADAIGHDPSEHSFGGGGGSSTTSDLTSQARASSMQAQGAGGLAGEGGVSIAVSMGGRKAGRPARPPAPTYEDADFVEPAEPSFDTQSADDEENSLARDSYDAAEGPTDD